MDVVFAVLPFCDVRRPALGVSLLKAGIARRGFRSRIEYLNMRLAELIGLPLYTKLANEAAPNHLIGEWFFADAVFGDEIPSEAAYISKMLSRSLPPDDPLIRQVLDARQKRPEFLNSCVERIAAASPRVVGFPSTFQQTCGCLAVARRLKELPDPPMVVFGGANCEGEMGRQLVDSFPWIDYVCAGEADETFPELLDALLTSKSGRTPEGVLKRGENGVAVPRPVRDMNSLATPDFDDFFEQAEAAAFREDVRIGVAVETSRGCWWGAKHKCVFCGLNPDRAPFRRKTAGRVREEILEVSRKHDIRQIETSDNILAVDYIDEVLPNLAGNGLEFFFEVKANLRYEHLAKMRTAGVNTVQPGIESLSDDILRRMNKGCTAAQNIQFLRWCEELGLIAAWNILAGFPGESPAEYDRMAQLVPLLMHLPPPATCTPIRLDRFSPLYEERDRVGFQRVRPASAYYYVYPLGRRELMRLAYYFDYDYADGRQPLNYLGKLQREIRRWWELRYGAAEQCARLDATFEGRRVAIRDTRDIAVAPTHCLEGLAARIYLACDQGQTVRGLAKSLGAGEGAIRSELRDLQDAKLTLEISDRFLSLAVFRKRPERTWGEEAYGDKTVRETASAEPLLRLV